jgi:uncharacterized protein DUF6457
VDVTQQGPLARWVAAVLDELGLAVDADRMTWVVLDLARDVAHSVDRPAAPVTAYLLGLAAGRAAGAEPDTGPDQATDQATAQVTDQATAQVTEQAAAQATEQATEQAAARIRRLLQGWSPAE